MAGLRMFPLVILMACINTIGGQVCPASNFPVAVMCTSGTWIGPRVFLDTSQTPQESKNCTCILETTAEEITVSLLTAPNFGGCQSSLEFKAADPFTFSCIKAGTAAQVSEKKEFEVYFKKSDDRFGNNYCADIQAKASPGGALTTVTLSCFGEAPTITSATSTTTSTTTTTTTTTTKPTTDFQMTSSQFTEQTSEGMITTDGITFTTTTEPKTTTSYVGYTGFPSSVSQTAIIIICVIVGAGLLVGIIIAVVAIMGKRNGPRRNVDKDRFSAPQNNNFELAAENGASNGRPKKSGRDDKIDDKLHRAKVSKDVKSHRVYDNKAYIEDDRSYRGDKLVVSERL